jgi:dipeptidyl aminopeptidase/acylaminoacyl peptidase
MPWDGCELWVADLGVSEAGPGGPTPGVSEPELVAGGTEESVGQPLWLSEDSLLFVSDRAGWWQPYLWKPELPAVRLSDLEADFHFPDWTLGQATMVALGTDKVACRIESEGVDEVVVVGLDGRAPLEMDQPCVAIRALCVADGELVVCGSTPTESGVILGVRADGHRKIASANSGVALDEAAVSLAEPMEFDTVGGVRAVLNLYRPAGVTREGESIVGLPGELPPVVVYSHGGPTSAAEAGFEPWIQYWTTRGFAVACVNYRGSTGRGRVFRKLLDQNWGVADAEDCVAALEFLAASGVVDGRRAMIRGGSSGGLTSLRALSIARSFAGALVYSGVTDLRALAEDTHKFESGYLEGLVGPYPEQIERYEERSPVCRPELIEGAVLLLQGEDDAVVPPVQAASMADTLRERGVRCEHVLFAGEGHGFRRADSIATAARCELEFTLDVLGIRSVAVEAPEA